MERAWNTLYKSHCFCLLFCEKITSPLRLIQGKPGGGAASEIKSLFPVDLVRVYFSKLGLFSNPVT